MPTLSLAMIVKDEAPRLGHCLDSVRGLVDERVVVDTGSTDGTPDLAREAGARVVPFAWTDDFAAARNESLRHCTGDWILVLDADEAVDARDHGVIRQALEQTRVPAFELTLRSYVPDGEALFLGRPVTPNDGTYAEGAAFGHYGDAPGLRLFRRFPDLRYRGRIHELLTPWFAERHLSVGTLPAVIHHYGKVEAAREAPKAAYYLELAQEEARRQPRSAQAQFNLMTQASVAGDWDLALEAGLAFGRLSRTVPPAVTATLALAHLQGERWAEALPLLQRLQKEDPGHRLPARQLPRVLTALGHGAEALDHLRRSIQATPDDPSPREQLIALALQQGLEAQAVAEAWEAIRRFPEGGGGHWHALVGAFLLKAGQVRQGAAVLALGRQAFPDHEGLRRLSDQAGG